MYSVFAILFGCLFCTISASSQDIHVLREQKLKSDNEIFSQLGQSVRNGGFSMDGYWIWGASVIKGDDSLYHMYVSRWPDSLLFHPGWLVASEVVHAISETPEGPYRFSDVALPARGAQYWDGRSTHNPQIHKYKDKYVLFYMGSTNPFKDPTVAEFENRAVWTPEIAKSKKKIMSLALNTPWATVARSNKRIGVALADSPFGPWKRFDNPALDTQPNTFYSFLTSNPSAVVHADGSVLLMFKSRAYKENRHGPMHIGIAKADSVDGKFTVLNNEQPIFNQLGDGAAEDPFMWNDERGYHVLFKDQKGLYTQEIGAGVLAHSGDGINWTIDRDPKAYSRTIEWDDGSVEMLAQMERTFLLFENGKPAFMFNATMIGGSYGFENGIASSNIVTKFRIE
jgi:hypothetical protein